MTAQDFSPALRAALDRFDVPAPQGGFADRIMSVTAPASKPVPRDRRGGWRLARRVIIGSVAAGMVSAAAVASGLLGAAGIRVPVLTAMLAPTPDPAPVRKTTAKAARDIAVANKRPVVPPPPAVALPVDASRPIIVNPAAMGPGLAQALERRAVRRAIRRAERQAFVRDHPELVPVIRAAMQQEIDFVAANPEVRALRRLPLTARQAYLDEKPELRAAIAEHQAARRAFRAANPEAVAIIRARIEQRRAAYRSAMIDAALEGKDAPPR